MSRPSQVMTGARIGGAAGVIFLVVLGGILFNLLAPTQAGDGLMEGPGEALLATVTVVVLGGLVVVATFAMAGALIGTVLRAQQRATVRRNAPRDLCTAQQAEPAADHPHLVNHGRRAAQDLERAF